MDEGEPEQLVLAGLCSLEGMGRSGVTPRMLGSAEAARSIAKRERCGRVLCCSSPTLAVCACVLLL